MRKLIAAAAGAALLGSVFAPPAEARGRWHRHHDDVDAGDVVAGAVVIGGIAALASAIGSGNQAKQDSAVDACSREAEARLDNPVAEISEVTKSKGYYTVEGSVEGGRGFTCVVRNGSLYSFQSADGEA